MKDTSIDKPSRKRRAEGIKLIGKVWKRMTPEEGKEGAWQFLAELETQTKATYDQEDGKSLESYVSSKY